MTATALCPRCCGCPDFDEDGRPYTCYFCMDTGSVTAEVAQEFERTETDYAEKFAPARLGIFLSRADLNTLLECDEFIEPAAGHRLFTRMVAVPRQPQPVADCWADDIPF